MRFLTDVSPPPHTYNNAVLVGLKALYSLYTTPFLFCSSSAHALHTPLDKKNDVFELIYLKMLGCFQLSTLKSWHVGGSFCQQF